MFFLGCVKKWKASDYKQILYESICMNDIIRAALAHYQISRCGLCQTFGRVVSREFQLSVMFLVDLPVSSASLLVE